MMKWMLFATVAVLGFFLVSCGRSHLAAWRFQRDGNPIPRFEELESRFVHEYLHDGTDHAIMGVAELAFGESGGKAVIVTGGKGQANAVLSIQNGRVRDVAAELGLEGNREATYGVTVADIDGDGVDEILFAQESGVYIYTKEPGEERYTARRLEVDMPENGVPLGVAAADTRKSGHLDLYISTYIDAAHNVTAVYNDPKVRVTNIFLENQGGGVFVDKTEASGLALHQNTFAAQFSDLTGNGFPDLVVALNTDRVIAYENLGDGKFKQHVLASGYGFWMGIAIGDITNNGRPDIFVSNVGKSIPAFMVKGDTRPDQPVDLSFKLFRNEGGFTFTEVSKELGADANVFGWGLAAADFTGNGRLDLVVTENYTAFPLNLHKYFPNPGKLLIQGEDGKFVATQSQSGVVNRHFGYAVLATDLNGDGTQDLVIGNLGGPLRIFINANEGA
jgi:hypothetical protein